MKDSAAQIEAKGGAAYLVMAVPLDANLDELADAIGSFIEDAKGVDAWDWREVVQNDFSEAITEATQDPRNQLSAIWTEGQLALVAPEDFLSRPDWDQLRAEIKDSQNGFVSESAAWDAIEASLPAAAHTATQTNVDRHAPIAASAYQVQQLRRFKRQEDGRHDVVAMVPIVLASPDEAALAAALEVLQERHETLHTSFSDFDGTTYLVLSDRAPVPFDVIQPFALRDAGGQRAESLTADLASQPMSETELWRVRLVKGRKTSAVVAVFSKAIADHKTVTALRKELVTLYEGFARGDDAEAQLEPVTTHFVDVPAVRLSKDALAFWEERLPHRSPAKPQQDTPRLAPVISFDHILSPAERGQIGTLANMQNVPEEVVLFSSFLTTLSRFEKSADWALLGGQDTRQDGDREVLGPLSIDLPIYLDKGAAADALSQAIHGVLQHGFVSHSDLFRAFPDRVPPRVPFSFEWQGDSPLLPPIVAEQDVSLRVQTLGDGLRLQWSIRKDYFLSLKQRSVKRTFLKVLKEAAQ